jgi:hypothetical protein
LRFFPHFEEKFFKNLEFALLNTGSKILEVLKIGRVSKNPELLERQARKKEMCESLKG